MRRIRAEPVCRINWIRRYDTFPSYRLCRKLHGPFSYAAGNAASYPLASFRQDRAWICWTEDSHRQSKEISIACNAIMSVQYVILYYIVGPTCWGFNRHVRTSLEI